MVYSLWAYILMGAGYDIPRAGLTALLQDRKENTMSKEEDKLNLDLSKYSTGSFDTITVSDWDMKANGIKESDLTITIDGKPLTNSVDGSAITLSTLKEIEHDAIVLNTDVKQGDLFNCWPEDGPPDPTTVTIRNLQEDDGYND